MEDNDVKGVIYELTAPEDFLVSIKGTLLRGVHRNGKNADGVINCEELNVTWDNNYIFSGGTCPFYPKELSIAILTPLERALYL